MAMPRTVEQIVEDQARAWKERRLRAGGAHNPPITISRMPGAQGDEVARQVSVELGYQLWDREIIQRVAVDANLSERLVAALDEKNRSFLADWLGSMMNERHLTRNAYVVHLTRVVGALGREGGAVIVGRGGHFILHHGEALRVLVTAPLGVRAAHIAHRDSITESEARRRIEAEETERRAFFQQCFRAEMTDPTLFDVVANTHVLGVEGAVRTVLAAFTALPEHKAKVLEPVTS